MKLKKSDVGRWCTTKWIDSGNLDGLIVDVELGKYPRATVFIPATNSLDRPQFDQFVELRGHVNAA